MLTTRTWHCNTSRVRPPGDLGATRAHARPTPEPSLQPDNITIQPDQPALSQARAVKRLLAHRLSHESAAAAKSEWYQIVEGHHSLWDGVSEPYKHMIRAFLIHFHMQILSHSTEQFNFTNGSIGERRQHCDGVEEGGAMEQFGLIEA